MALKATVCKAALQIADMDRQLYADHAVTLARHPSETDERMMVRLLAFALNVPQDDFKGSLQFGRGLSDVDEPDLARHDLGGQLQHWIDVGQPDERRLLRACSRAERVTLYAYASSVPTWWAGLQNRLQRQSNLVVWQLPAAQSQALAGLAQRSMQLQLTIQDGHIWVSDSQRTVEVLPQALFGLT